MSGLVQLSRDARLVIKARRAGCPRYALRIIRECRRVGLTISLGFALIEHESGFRNVFGHDNTIFAGAGVVTKAKYLRYKRERGRDHMQGVGPAQLTWWATQDKADKRGGCWRPGINIAVALEDLAGMIKAHGYHGGIKAYNGSGSMAEAYAVAVSRAAEHWHEALK